MAGKHFNLLDYARRFGENSQEIKVAEVLTKTNEILEDALVLESNLDSGHQYAMRTSIPEGTWRAAYEGVQPTKATTKIVTKPFGTLANNSVVDALVAEKGGNVAAVRKEQADAIMEGISNSCAKKIFYGDKTDSKAFEGLASFYGELSGSEASKQVLDGGSKTANRTSIYLLGWGPGKIYTFFPKGSKAGIKRIDYTPGGPMDVEAENKKGTFPGYKEHFQWQLGLAVQDYRYGGRIANIDLDAIGDADLLKLMNKLESKIESKNGVRLFWYMHRDAKYRVREAISAKSNVQFSAENPTGKPLMMYNEIFTRTCDAISLTEEAVV